jgi:hypothetical protein
MIRAGVHEEIEDKICHFYVGLQTEIQDIVTIKNTILERRGQQEPAGPKAEWATRSAGPKARKKNF